MRSLIAIFIATLSFLQADEMSPTPIYSPEESAEMFEFAEPGYRIELVASEPMVQDPVAIRFDGQGRLWVVEMRGYMRDVDGSDSHKPTGRISVLTDTYGDGLMDESSVFLDGLVLPRAIAILPDGVLVAENKPLWFVQDTDGDLVADEKTLIDENYARDNIEHSANGLYRALDNWFYNAKEGHRYRRVAGEWIREKTERRGQWGICQDNRGRLFYNYNHSQLFTDLVPPNSFSRNPNHVPTTGVNVNVVMSNEVFPIRPNLATNRGYIPGTLDENGSIQQFTSACAPVIYRESLFPEFADNAFVAETAGNLIKRNQLSLTGISATGQPAYPDRDFLASKDERFRPCAIEPGPDGAIYIVDMYRGIVQDAPHMSPYLREISVERKME
ncbi:MAG: dehydrogenase, partial [Verrucomicrobiota bacterium]